MLLLLLTKGDSGHGCSMFLGIIVNRFGLVAHKVFPVTLKAVNVIISRSLEDSMFNIAARVEDSNLHRVREFSSHRYQKSIVLVHPTGAVRNLPPMVNVSISLHLCFLVVWRLRTYRPELSSADFSCMPNVDIASVQGANGGVSTMVGSLRCGDEIFFRVGFSDIFVFSAEEVSKVQVVVIVKPFVELEALVSNGETLFEELDAGQVRESMFPHPLSSIECIVVCLAVILLLVIVYNDDLLHENDLPEEGAKIKNEGLAIAAI
ncbi:hypothetical protein PG985_012862 [Apiospora marii]|uniref:Uncharacterized protein n=1 Tax=Apiospora marii TaxID=335849 RepID=A0ABR1RC15_9PEZI